MYHCCWRCRSLWSKNSFKTHSIITKPCKKQDVNNSNEFTFQIFILLRAKENNVLYFLLKQLLTFHHVYYHHHHYPHKSVPLAQIPFSLYLSLSFLHLCLFRHHSWHVLLTASSVHGELMNGIFIGQPNLMSLCVGVQRSTFLIHSSFLFIRP